MLQDQDGLLNADTPLIFADGSEMYADFAKEFIVHTKGFFILGPSGVGKSYFVRRQYSGEKHWIDADQLWRNARAMPLGAWWEDLDLILEVEQQCDVITAQAKKQGFWLLGSACNWLRPDAVVLPKWQTNVKYIKEREKNYDGGITSDRLPQLLSHRKEIRSWVKKGVPKFESVSEATRYLKKLYDAEVK